jgi:diaminopimelate epimerase
MNRPPRKSQRKEGGTSLKFTKMHGAGNDFVMIDAISQHLKLRPGDIQRIADRRLGVGCDQVLLAEAPQRPDADFRYRIFNGDGSEAGQCGNGARCFARFVRHRRLTRQSEMVVETLSGLMTLTVHDNHRVTVNLGPPRFAPAQIPLRRSEEAREYALQVGDQSLTVGALSMGNPHAVLRRDDIHDGCVETLGPLIERHEDFPEGVNAGFLQVIDRGHVRLRVHERGAGETLACGSGAAAAAVHGQRMGWLDEQVTVELPGGKLEIRWAGGTEPVYLTGPTAISFEGSLRL